MVRKARSPMVCLHMGDIVTSGPLGGLAQSPHISHWFHHWSTGHLLDVRRVDSWILATPIMLCDEALGAAFCRHYRNEFERLRESRGLERSSELGPLVRGRCARVVAVDFLSRLVDRTDARAVAAALALGDD